MRYARWPWSMSIAIALTAVAVLGCREVDSAVPVPAPTALRLITGTPSTYFAHALVEQYAGTLPHMPVSVSESAGNFASLEALQQGRADLGFVMSDAAYMAFAGRAHNGLPAFDRLRGIAVFPVSAVHLFVRRGLQISSPAQLRGKKVSLGQAAGATPLTANLILRAYGLQPGDVDARTFSFDEAIDVLGKGDVDAVFMTVTHPSPVAREFAERGARLVTLDGDPIRHAQREYPFLAFVTIPANTYPNQPLPVRTVGVEALYVCREGLTSQIVYEVTREFFSALPVLAQHWEAIRPMDLDHAPATAVPLHDGAVRYYRERELAR